MDERRREVAKGLTAVAATLVITRRTGTVMERTASYGRIGSLIAAAGQRDALVAALIAGAARMPGCMSYVVAKDAGNADTIWITELWESQESHAASLKLPQVREAITKAKPLITGFGQIIVLEPVADVA
jgi:quinol monooxygenase YgiN